GSTSTRSPALSLCEGFAARPPTSTSPSSTARLSAVRLTPRTRAARNASSRAPASSSAISKASAPASCSANASSLTSSLIHPPAPSAVEEKINRDGQDRQDERAIEDLEFQI